MKKTARKLDKSKMPTVIVVNPPTKEQAKKKIEEITRFINTFYSI